MTGKTARAATVTTGLASIASPAVAEPRSEGFVNASTLVPGLLVEMRYFGSHNFVGRPVDGYKAPVCVLTREAAEALAKVQADLKNFGLGLKVFDCYRPARAVADFLRWSKDTSDTKMKSEFYPDLDKTTLFDKGYIAKRSSHSRGSTADLTLVDRTTKTELPMGTGFDLFSERSWADNPQQSTQIRANRLLLSSIMQRHGFEPYQREWWHFRLKNEPYSDTYFDFRLK